MGISRTHRPKASHHFAFEVFEPRRLFSNGIFSAETDTATGLASEQVVGQDLVDLNHDGKLDLVVVQESTTVNYEGQFTVFLGNGDGTFGAVRTTQLDGGPLSLAVGDMNGDGIPDLAIAVTSDNVNANIEVFHGKGDGTVDAPVSVTANDANIRDLQIADINGDGKPDFVYSDSTAAAIQLQNSNGMFAAPLLAASGPAGTNVSAVAVADLNGDGKPDLVTGEDPEDGGGVTVSLGNGDGTFGPATTYDTTGTQPDIFAIGDFNGDGHPDIAVRDNGLGTFNGDNGTVDVLINKGDGTFNPVVPYGGFSEDLAAVDVNGDGHTDLLTSSGGVMTAFLGAGDGTFPDTSTSTIDAGIAHLMVGDLNGDGKPDLVFLSENGSTIGTLLNNGGLGVAPKLLVTFNPTIAASGAPVTITATITPPAAGDPVPTGTIDFEDSLESPLGTGTLTPTGSGAASASFTTTATLAGGGYYYVSYPGDLNYTAVLNIFGVSVEPPTLSIALGKTVVPTSATVVPGNPVKYAAPFTVTNTGTRSSGNFAADLQLINSDGTVEATLSSVTKSKVLATKGKLAFSFKSVPFPTSLAAGTYYFQVQVTGPTGVTALANPGGAITVGAADPEVSATLVVDKAITLKLNQTATFTVDLVNFGDVDVKGPAHLTLSLSSNQDSASSYSALYSKSFEAKLTVGKSTKMTVHLKYTKALAAGVFHTVIDFAVPTDNVQWQSTGLNPITLQ